MNIDFNDPTRAEAVLFPNEASVTRFVTVVMQASLDLITDIQNDPEKATTDDGVEAIARNKEYLVMCLRFQSVQDSGFDLAPFIAATQ